LLLFSTFFSSIIEDNDEPGGSLSSLGFFLKCKRRRWVRILAHWHSWLFCFSCKRWQ
jgi:hypothetical protein